MQRRAAIADLPEARDQVHTRALRFAELRTHVYEQIRAAKRGAGDGRPARPRPFCRSGNRVRRPRPDQPPHDRVDHGRHPLAHLTAVGRPRSLPDAEIGTRLARADLRATPPAPSPRRTPCAEPRRVRRQGYALVDQEPEDALRSVVAPVRDRDGEVGAA